MSNKRGLTQNFYLSLTMQEPVLNSYSLYNNLPIGLMILSKICPTSPREKEESNLKEKNNEEFEKK